eukprot:10861500-Alexandrium_andersonii.AAC.1
MITDRRAVERNFDRSAGRKLNPQERVDLGVKDPLVHHPALANVEVEDESGQKCLGASVPEPLLGDTNRDARSFTVRGDA